MLSDVQKAKNCTIIDLLLQRRFISLEGEICKFCCFFSKPQFLWLWNLFVLDFVADSL